MPAWKRVWREGIVPQLPLAGLRALELALAKDDRRLIQKQTTYPPPVPCLKDRLPEGACALGFCGWQADGARTVEEVEEFFAKVCFEADRAVGEAAACRFFLNAYDDWDRETMRRQLAPEVAWAIAEKQRCQSSSSVP